jgi:hypothetical protein
MGGFDRPSTSRKVAIRAPSPSSTIRAAYGSLLELLISETGRCLSMPIIDQCLPARFKRQRPAAPKRASMARAREAELHCGVRPERRTTSRHIIVSLAAKAAASAGVLEKSRAPATKNRLCIDCSAAISFCAVASLSTIAGGVAIGMT